MPEPSLHIPIEKWPIRPIVIVFWKPNPIPAIDIQPGRLAYLFSRYPYVAHTFCDSEMMALEASGWELAVGSFFPPEDSFRHERLMKFGAPVFYAPPPRVLPLLEARARADGSWPEDMVARHEEKYGPDFQSASRCRNALYFADLFQRLGIQHVHVHFANRATHSMLFLKQLTGIPFSFTTHGQDFMVDLGSDELLREMCREAAFSVAVCDYSRDLLAEICPESAEKIVRIYNGLDPSAFENERPVGTKSSLKLVSTGRLIEFKGFHRLIAAVAKARAAGVDATLRIIGEGPWEARLRDQIAELGLAEAVTLTGRLPLETVTAELQAADAFALGSIVDSKGASDLLPTVITEAMLSRLPVISTRVAGIPEMIDDGETGFLAGENDEEGLAAAIGKVAADPEKAREMGEAGRKKAIELFSLAVTVPQLAVRFAESIESSGIASETLAPPDRAIAYYDLALPRRVEWLAAEFPVLKARGCRVIVAGGRADREGLDSLDAEVLDGIEWLPDGMVLEMEWRARESWRIELETLRTELSSAVDGEIFLRAARRAVWLAVHQSRIAPDCDWQFGPGIEESLTLWLASHLAGPDGGGALVCAFENDRRWSRVLLKRIAKDAGRLSDASGRIEKGDAADPLHHGTPPPLRKRLGPINWKVPIEPPTPEERQSFLNAWLEASP